MTNKSTSARSPTARHPFTTLISVTANETPTDTPIPDTLRLWQRDRHSYILRSNTPMTPDSKTDVFRVLNEQVATDIYLGLQSTLSGFQECYGRTTTVNHFLRSENNRLSDEKLKSTIISPNRYCDREILSLCPQLPLPVTGNIQSRARGQLPRVLKTVQGGSLQIAENTLASGSAVE